MKKKTISVLLSAMMAAGCLVVPAAASESKSVEDLLLEPYEETVDIHVVLQYRESEDPLTPTDCTPETSTAVKKLKEDLNINVVYDWVASSSDYDEKMNLCIGSNTIPELMNVNAEQSCTVKIRSDPAHRKLL